jgi:hypothetical protein
VCAQDPTCCTVNWTASCVLKVQTACGYQCEPGENICSNATPITAGKFFGTLVGQNNDGCASAEGSPGGVSCRSPDVWFSYTAGEFPEKHTLATCASQFSFGIDTVSSVHEGCPGKTNNEIVANDDHLLGAVPGACSGDPSPIHLDSAVSLEAFHLDPFQTVVIRISVHDDSVANPFEMR